MEEIIRAYWDCPYCSNKDIDGLLDVCPSCGSRKPSNIKYKMLNPDDVVTEGELIKAGIDISECDGNHKEWACSFCGRLNNYADNECVGCGAPKSEKSGEYGDFDKNGRNLKKIGGSSSRGTKDDKGNSIEKGGGNPSIPHDGSVSSISRDYSINNTKGTNFKRIFSWLIIILLLIIGLFPYKKCEVVTGFEWGRCITVEEKRTVHEEDWIVPASGIVTDKEWRFKNYKNVLDHYERVAVKRTKQVIDHYEKKTSYRDNGNGTFSEITDSIPVYKTVTYVDYEEKPVYRKEAVYDWWYEYDIDRWFDVKDYPSKGTNHEPYWNTRYSLADNQRDTDRTEDYWVVYDNKHKRHTKYTKWAMLSKGDKVIKTKCLLGFVYSQKVESNK